MTIGQNARNTQAALAFAAALAAPATAWAGIVDTYYERAFVVAADQRCDLFRPELAAALQAATAQARGAALRAGARAADLDMTAHRARTRAAATSCADPDLAVVRGRVHGAFSGWARTPRMTFEGARGGWAADRLTRGGTGWSLVQAGRVGASPVRFGTVGQGQAARLTAVVSFAGRPRPYAARLVFRDERQFPRPWLSGEGAAPVSGRASVWADRGAKADVALLATGAKQGEAWSFPLEALGRLGRLDPREAFAVEFHFRDGTVARAPLEVGDLAAARAFLAMGAL